MFGRSDHLNKLIDNLKKQISTAKTNANKTIPTQILDAALEALEKSNTHDETQLLDLYITAKGMVTIAINTTQIELAEKIRLFFATRARKIKGQTEDYNSNTPANVFCHRIAKLIFPNESAWNVLLEEALTKERAEPWMDYIEYSTDLPPEGDWFRNLSNEVHNYATILERAICRLKEGYTKRNEVWLGSDPKSINTPLSSADLDIIKQRTPTFYVLVDYTNSLEAAIQSQSKNAYEYFHELRAGLLKGDAAHGGEELQAGDDAYIAIAIFSEWWNRLNSTTQQKIKNLTIPSSCYGMNCMNDILNIILDDGHASQRDQVQYCIKLKGQRLDEFLNHSTIKQQLQTIQEGVIAIDPRTSNKTLESWQEKITNELKTVQPLIQQENRLSAYAQSKGIVLQAFINEFFNLNVLEEKTISQSIHWWHQKYPLNQTRITSNSLSTMIKDIYAQQDVNVLLLLYAHYAYQPQKEEKVLLTTIKTRLHDLSKMKGFSFNHLQKEFPFFDTLSLQDEEIAYATFIEKFYRPVVQEDWQELITYLTHCNPDWLTPVVFQQMLQHADTTQPPPILYLNQNDSSYQACLIPDLLKKIYAEKVLRKEISVYKRTVENRLWQRHDVQRDTSIASVESVLDQPLVTRESNINLIAHIKRQIRETQAEHEKGIFSWFTNSNLVQAYKRALTLMELDGDDSNGNNDNSPSPSWWQRLYAWLWPSLPSHIPGDRPPPPPPGAAGAAAAIMLVNVEPYMPLIQAEVSEWRRSREWQYQFRQFLIANFEDVREQMSTFRQSYRQAGALEGLQQIDSTQEQVVSTHGYVMTSLARNHHQQSVVLSAPAPALANVEQLRNWGGLFQANLRAVEASDSEHEQQMILDSF